MRRPAAAVALAIMAAGCATTDLADSPPPSIERALAGLRAERGCAAFADIRSTAAQASVAERCPAIYPEALNLIGITANCRSMFDLSEDGRAENIQSRCTVNGQPSGAYHDEWTAFAETLFAASADRSFEAYRVEVDELGPGGPTTNLSAITYFRSTRNASPELTPEPFERTAQ